jgi:hypothetical protein
MVVSLGIRTIGVLGAGQMGKLTDPTAGINRLGYRDGDRIRSCSTRQSQRANS